MRSRSELQGILAWSALPQVGARTLQALLIHAAEERRTLADLWQSPPEALAEQIRLRPRTQEVWRAEGEERWRRAAEAAAQITTRGVDVLAWGDLDLPAAIQALQQTSREWPVCYAYGALGLLEQPRAALVSSRAPSHASLAVTDALADALSRRDVPLLSGTNREAYQAAATAAKRHAGPSLLVLDRGIAEAFPDGLEREPVAASRVWDAAFDPDIQLLLSPFGWAEPWNPRSGKRRDALIFGLADLVIAIDISPGGGMDGLCRGRQGGVAALDRGDDTPDGVRALWDDGVARRIVWRGGDRTAEELLSQLPADPREAPREDGSRRKDLALFLLRAAQRLGPAGARPRVEAAGTGPFTQVASQWRGSGPPLILLAEFGEGRPEYPSQALSGLSQGDFLAALMPVEWLEDERFRAQREEWRRLAEPCVTARLPTTPGMERKQAAVVLVKGRSALLPRTFAPRQPVMGRFHLRRYLSEVLAELGDETGPSF